MLFGKQIFSIILQIDLPFCLFSQKNKPLKNLEWYMQKLSEQNEIKGVNELNKIEQN